MLRSNAAVFGRLLRIGDYGVAGSITLGAVFLLFWLIRHGAATKVASLMYLVPPCTALVAWPLFGETYTLYSAAGMAVAMLAVWLVSKG